MDMQGEGLSNSLDNLIQVSAAAREELLRLGGAELRSAGFLRLVVVPGGCTGLTYEMGVDAVQTPFDRLLYRDEELRVVSDGASFRYLKGLSIDYTTDLVKAGFRFLNPNAVSSCGCGSSFAAQEGAAG
jgi:iron-sulfur cluster assembly accessory protein